MSTPSDSQSSDPASSSAPVTVSKSGIITDANGVSHIPSSVRADGSVRPQIRVKPGYRPPEDVEAYRNRYAEAWRTRGSGSGVIPGAESFGKSTPEKKGDNKNAKRREARKKAAAAKSGEDAGTEPKVEAAAAQQNQEAEEVKKEEVEDPEAEKQKEAKKLLKKLRQARDLKDKKDEGAALLPEQFEKVIRISELIRQLDGLGFDSEGERKGDKREGT